jgi:hypothetical protein
MRGKQNIFKKSEIQYRKQIHGKCLGLFMAIETAVAE